MATSMHSRAAPPAPSLASRFADTRAGAWLRWGVQAGLRVYLRVWHDFEVQGLDRVPRHGPALALTNHCSYMDVPVLMVADPYPNSRIVAKSSLFKLPFVRQGLQLWRSIPVDRGGRDLAGVRAILLALKQGAVVAIAAEGTRSPTGRLQAINPVLARLAVAAQVPLIPIGIGGSFDALPRGARIPRRRKIVLRLGAPFRLPRGTSDAEAAARIQAEIARLLPPDQQPLAPAIP